MPSNDCGAPSIIHCGFYSYFTVSGMLIKNSKRMETNKVVFKASGWTRLYRKFLDASSVLLFLPGKQLVRALNSVE